jgi:nucleoside-diphosphate-sugar epimerase
VGRKHYLVTGGTGFMGAALVHRLVHQGHRVRLLDNNSRGNERRLRGVAGDVEFVIGDIRDPDVVSRAIRGVDTVHHLAFVNGTANFYDCPDLVVDVGAKGIINVVDACRRHGIRELFVASSSEVYQMPPRVPTDESVPLVVPDLMNPRSSYGGTKLFSELYAVHVAYRHLERVIIYRPHNVYGPDMGWEHVIPEFAVRIRLLAEDHPTGILSFPIQGTGTETRSFCFIDDFIDGLAMIEDCGDRYGVFHIGTQEEVCIADLAHRIATCLGREIRIVRGALRLGSTARRCPAIDKLSALGFLPRVALNEGLAVTCGWYFDYAHLARSTDDRVLANQ